MWDDTGEMTTGFWDSTTEQYKFQLRGSLLTVAFQLFGVAFLYLIGWNYSLVRNSLTPMFWAVLFSIALHSIKSSIVNYLVRYDARLNAIINPIVDNIQSNSRYWFWIPRRILIPIARIFCVLTPFKQDFLRAFVDVSTSLPPAKIISRRLSQTLDNFMEMSPMSTLSSPVKPIPPATLDSTQHSKPNTTDMAASSPSTSSPSTSSPSPSPTPSPTPSADKRSVSDYTPRQRLDFYRSDASDINEPPPSKPNIVSPPTGNSGGFSLGSLSPQTPPHLTFEHPNSESPLKSTEDAASHYANSTSVSPQTRITSISTPPQPEQHMEPSPDPSSPPMPGWKKALSSNAAPDVSFENTSQETSDDGTCARLLPDREDDTSMNTATPPNTEQKPSLQKQKSRFRDTFRQHAIMSKQVSLRVSSVAFSPYVILMALCVVMSTLLINADAVQMLGLSTLIINLFIVVGIVSFLFLAFVLLPKWSRDAYNVFVVVFLIVSILSIITLTAGVLLFKLMDEVSRFVTVMNSIVDNSELFKNLEMDSYINEASTALLEQIHNYLPIEDADTINQIWANRHLNWTDAFQKLFTAKESNNSDVTAAFAEWEMANMSAFNGIDFPISDEWMCPINDDYVTVASNYNANVYADTIEPSIITAPTNSSDDDILNSIVKYAFGNDSKVLKIMDYLGLDLTVLNSIFSHVRNITTLVSTNLFGILGLILSFGSYIIHLGLDFMVFLACLFYLLLASESLLIQVKKMASFIPSQQSSHIGYSQFGTPQLSNTVTTPQSRRSDSLLSASKQQNSKRILSREHFLDSLFKSIQDIFVVTFLIAILHAFVTWFTFRIFRVDFAFVSAFGSGIFSIIPYFPPWIVCLHAVIYLMYHSRFVEGAAMFLAHVGLLWIDPYVYNRIENSHPYLTGLSIVLGLAEFGLNGVIVGPLLVCFTTWSFRVIGFFLMHFATFEAVRKEEIIRKRTSTVKKSRRRSMARMGMNSYHQSLGRLGNRLINHSLQGGGGGTTFNTPLLSDSELLRKK